MSGAENGERSAGLFSASAAMRQRRSDDEATVVHERGGTSAEEEGDKEKSPTAATAGPIAERRVDFVWLVRDRTHLLWFSDLLNRVTQYALDLNRQSESSSSSATGKVPIDLRVNTFITAKRKNISTHVFRILLDRYRTEASPVSALTGLKVESSFGRPDLEAMLDAFYADLRAEPGGFRGNVGVFFCGAPVIGRLLADQCGQLTARARADKMDVRFHFLNEVFG